jgi:Tfp pilus assembly protein PilN
MKAVNLIPAEQRSGAPVGAGRSEGAAYAVIVLLGGLALLALLYGQARHQISSRKGEAATLSAQAQHAQEATNQLAPYTSFIALREQRTQAVAQLVDTRFDWAHVFREFGRVLPAQTSISTLTGTIASGPAATTTAPSASSAKGAASSSVISATPPGSTPSFTVTGCAASQAAVALTLERLRLIDGVSDVALQSSTAQATASSAAVASSGGGCPSKDPVFQIEISFEPLPQPTAATAAVAAATGAPGGAR